MKELTIEAQTEKLTEVLDFVGQVLDPTDCSMKDRMQIDLSVEEIFVNITSYAYPSGEGMAVIRAGLLEDSSVFVISFADKGIPYDPLKREDPDIHLSVQEREVGGLGVFLVKKNMDEVSYEYKDGQNILTMKKNLKS